MAKNLAILAVLAVIIALPFVFRQPPPQGEWKEGDPTLVIVSPHNEAIRFEFAQAFSKWHKAKYGKPVKIDWRNIGGTSEIGRYLASEYSAAARSWWQAKGKPWPSRATDDLTASAQPSTQPSQATIDGGTESLRRWQIERDQSNEIWKVYRSTDAADLVTCKIDLFFGGGEFDHSDAFRRGFAVPVADKLPPTLFAENGVDMIPASFSGETWRTPSVMGNVVSTFGIIYNVDRLKDLGVAKPPLAWSDLTSFAYFGQIGLADPTKSASITKAFEMIVHQQMHDAAFAAGFSNETIAENERVIAAYKKDKGPAYKRGDVPIQCQPYQAALEKGFNKGIQIVQEIGANSRYFTDSGSKVPIDVSVGDAAVGMAIDFYGRFQAESTRAPNGDYRMQFVTPPGGTSVSVDPISLLRGSGGNGNTPQEQAEIRQVALHFIEFLLGDDGQKLWTYKPGTPGGPTKYSLRRLPIRRSFYPSTAPGLEGVAVERAKYATDDLTDPQINPYEVGKNFTYYPRWTGDHFSVLRDFVRAMCMDAGDELKRAWKISNEKSQGWTFEMPAIELTDAKGESKTVQLSWANLPDVKKSADPVELSRSLMLAFRGQYEKVH